MGYLDSTQRRNIGGGDRRRRRNGTSSSSRDNFLRHHPRLPLFYDAGNAPPFYSYKMANFGVSAPLLLYWFGHRIDRKKYQIES